MTTLVTVPGGATGTPVATFTFQDTNTTGISVAKSIANALANSVTKENLGVTVAGGAGPSTIGSTVVASPAQAEVYVKSGETNNVTIGTGFGYVVNNSGAKATVSASADARLISNTFGGLFYLAGNATLVAAGGDNKVTQYGKGSIFLSTGEGNDTIAADGAGTIAGGAGNNAITLNGNGQFVLSRGNDAITIGGGATLNNDTIDVSAASNTTIFGSDGKVRFVSSGVAESWLVGADSKAADTITATSGSETSVTADPSRGLVFRAASGGKGNVNTGAAGSVGTTVFGGSSSNINVSGGGGSNGNPVFVVAGDGNSTLNASASTGPVWLSVNTSAAGAAGVILTGGSGADFLVIGGAPGSGTLTGGAGKDAFVFFKQITGGGANTITDFNPSEDSIFIEGYGITAAQRAQFLANAGVSGSSVTLNLGDGTSVTFLNTARDQLLGHVHTS